MAQPDGPQSEPPPVLRAKQKFLKSFKLFGRSQPHDDYATSTHSFETSQPVARAQSITEGPTACQHDAGPHEPLRHAARGRTSRSVVPGLPRAQTFKRQLSEDRSRLSPVEPTPEERRAVSMDRRSHAFHTRNYGHIDAAMSETNAFELGHKESNHPAHHQTMATAGSEAPNPPNTNNDDILTGIGVGLDHHPHELDDFETQDFDDDRRSTMSSLYHDDHAMADMIARELETTWILNLSMRYKDRSNREKFFVTYREHEQHWRRVTVTLDYRNAPEDSLEEELREVRSQREKSSKIYESIRQSLQEIQFYETVTNLKLETTDGRLHVHVVEDANEIIQYPHVSQVAHLGCRRIKEEDIVFIHHMSGFVYKVTVDDETLIKKEIPGPETIDEFLYEINALNSLRYSDNVIKFYGLVVDDIGQVKGLLISYADGGALIDVIYDNCKADETKSKGIIWSLKERWARQIVHGLADVHECGFVQGDFTLSNIVIDEYDNAKIIDINRRGCPVGWEPPEATPLIESQHRISMYIGVKSDLYQLGMVLWAIAMDEDEPEREGRPLSLGADAHVPGWYRQITEICLSPDPRKRLQASMLLQLFPAQEPTEPCITVDDGHGIHDLTVNEFHPDGHPRIRVENLPRKFWSPERSYSPGTNPAHQSWHYAPRGRSPPSPMPSNYDESKSPGRFDSRSSWAANRAIRASYSDAGGDEVRLDEVAQQFTPNTSVDRGPLPTYHDVKDEMVTGEDDQVTPAVATAEGVEKEIHDAAQQPIPSDAGAVEDAQATPTQETVDTGGDKDVKGDENALQEISGNVTKLSSPLSVPEASAEGDCAVPQESEKNLALDPEIKETEAPLETVPEVPKSEEIAATADEEARADPPAEVVSEEPIGQEKELVEKPPLSEETGDEADAPTHHSEEALKSTPESDKTVIHSNEPADLLPTVINETNDEEVSREPPGAHDEQLAQTAVETVEPAKGSSASITGEAEPPSTDKEEQTEKPEPEDQTVNQVQSDAPQTTNETAPETEQVPSNEDTDTLPTATTEPIPTSSDIQAQDGMSAPSEAHVKMPSAPGKENATPRISPSLPEDTSDHSNTLAGIGGDMQVDDHLMQARDICDDDFQLVDRPSENVPTFVITSDTTI